MGWDNGAKLRISDEVKRFQANLMKINRKYATGYAAKTAQKIRKAVRGGVKTMTGIEKNMQKAADKAVHKAQRKYGKAAASAKKTLTIICIWQHRAESY